MVIINYKDLDSKYYSTLSISKDMKGKDMIVTEKYDPLIPDEDFEGRIESEEQVRNYIRKYYIEVLSKLDPEKIYREFEYNYKKLVTFDDGEFSHGYIVSAWLELFLDVKVPCVNKMEIYKKPVDIKPRWVMDVLEEEIKKTIDNMRGFNSVKALYLFMKGEKLEEMADKLEEKLFNNYGNYNRNYGEITDKINNYRQSASFLRCDADMAEDAWRERRRDLVEEAKKKKLKSIYGSFGY